MASSSSPSPPLASPSRTNPNPHAGADPRSDPSMPAASDGDGASPASTELQEEAELAAPGKEELEPPTPAEETPTPRKTRLPRACNSKPRLPPPPPLERLRRRAAAGADADVTPQCRVVTPLVSEPEAPAELARWRLRCMWELGSVLNFFHVFRALLNITVELTAEDIEAALITPNGTLYDLHMPLLKSIPPITRMAMGRGTWVTVLCRKLRDWWHWVAEGDLPIVASHGAEIEMYKELEPSTRLLILKAICDIRVEQDDIRNYIDTNVKRGYDLSTFRKERIGGDSLGISYWYEDDPILGHRLYREIRRVEQMKKEPGKRSKGRRISTPPVVSYHWETVASTFEEFDDVAEKLSSSRNRTEVSLGKKLKIEYLPEIEKIHKKEKMLKKQQREALLLDSYLTSDITTGRSLRDRKPVTYTFDDYDRSINEAIKITKYVDHLYCFINFLWKRENSAELVTTLNRRMLIPRQESSSNGKLNGLSLANELDDGNSSKSDDYQDSDGEQENEALDRSNRRRRRSQRYTQDFVQAVSDIDLNFDSDDDIMGEAVYDEEYLRTRKLLKTSSASEEDEEFRLEEDVEDDDEEEEEEFSAGTSEDIEEPQRHKKLRSQNVRGAKLRSVDEIQTGLRRSKRSSRPRINYQQYDFSDTDAEAGKAGKSDASDPDANSDAENGMELSTSSQGQQEEEDDGPEELKVSNGNDKMAEDHAVAANKEQKEEQLQLQPESVEKMDAPSRENGSVGRTFLDLNELAPGGGFDEGPSLAMKDEDMDNS
ncbi:DDT domain-containing protein DDR4 isoform X2 [Triticum aestivum]|uniref:DDT domain-containing protein DDR4 isoform X2 n=1 Tax=Triticum aestivum TaxID=4565 RepID=UPI001D022EC5|nr:DDT domain-containing protein DDR4-like isoform X2 [Triticum aestivum]